MLLKLTRCLNNEVCCCLLILGALVALLARTGFCDASSDSTGVFAGGCTALNLLIGYERSLTENRAGLNSFFIFIASVFCYIFFI